MKTLLVFISSLCAFAAFSQPANDNNRFLVKNRDLYGYINRQGAEVLKPAFAGAQEFSEGLAGVRVNGTYGFIDTSGHFKIAAQYDFVHPFHEGYAIVYKDGVPFYIDKNNRPGPATTGFKRIGDFHNGRALVITETGKQGYINATGQLVIDTIYSEITLFNYGLAGVRLYDSSQKHAYGGPFGVIDLNGKQIVPLGKYDRIENFWDGCALLTEYLPKDTAVAFIGIDTTGKEIFRRKYNRQYGAHSGFSSGLAVVSLYKYWIPEEKGVISTSEKSYKGAIDHAGNIVINDTSYKDMKPFSGNRSFAGNDPWVYFLVDKTGRHIGPDRYSSAYPFANGLALVRIGQKWGFIDSNGRQVVPAKYDHIFETGIVNERFFFYRTAAYDDKAKIGMADIDGHIIIKPQMEGYDPLGFKNGLLKTEINGLLTFFNEQGNIVWQEKKPSKELTYLDLDVMNRGYFYAHPSRAKPPYIKYPRNNFPRKITTENFPKQSITIIIDTTHPDTFDQKYFGWSLYLVNTTGDTVKFNTQDNRLFLNLQALNSKNEWADIEFLPRSWCGNSYYDTELEPDAYWKFSVPVYKGSIPTKIRAVLTYNNRKDHYNAVTLYSNTIDGSVNPGQFWNKGFYNSSGIMDPYDD